MEQSGLSSTSHRYSVGWRSGEFGFLFPLVQFWSSSAIMIIGRSWPCQWFTGCPSCQVKSMVPRTVFIPQDPTQSSSRPLWKSLRSLPLPIFPASNTSTFESCLSHPPRPAPSDRCHYKEIINVIRFTSQCFQCYTVADRRVYRVTHHAAD